jgi:hypothetical protein
VRNRVSEHLAVLLVALLAMSACAHSPAAAIKLPESEINQILAVVYSNTECRVKKVKQLDDETVEAEAFSGSRNNGVKEILTLKKKDGQWVLKDKATELFCPG